MEDALKCLKITIKILAKMSNSMWEVLLAMKEKMKQPTGIIMNTKAYMGTHRTKITVHRMSITELCGGLFRQLWSCRGGECRLDTK